MSFVRKVIGFLLLVGTVGVVSVQACTSSTAPKYVAGEPDSSTPKKDGGR